MSNTTSNDKSRPPESEDVSSVSFPHTADLPDELEEREDDVDVESTMLRSARAEVLLELLGTLDEMASRPSCHRDRAVLIAIEADRLVEQVIALRPENDSSLFDSVDAAARAARESLRAKALHHFADTAPLVGTTLDYEGAERVVAAKIDGASVWLQVFALAKGAFLSWRDGWMVFQTAPSTLQWFNNPDEVLVDLGPTITRDRVGTALRVAGILDEGYSITQAYEVAAASTNAMFELVGL